MAPPRFRRDLYRGTAPFYDRFRLAYPPALLEDLVARAALPAGASLLDLACGTGQVALALREHFDQVWAVDREREMISFARDRAKRQGVANVRWIVQRAENVAVGPAHFDLITIGNAFHRLDRARVAKRSFNLLHPGRCLAVLWSDTPWRGSAPWQLATAECLDRWMDRSNSRGRIPSGLDQLFADEPHDAVLRAASFEVSGPYEFVVPHEWSVPELTGFVLSTSFLSRPALGNLASAFEDDLRETLLGVAPSGAFHQGVRFAYQLARRPPDGA